MGKDIFEKKQFKSELWTNGIVDYVKSQGYDGVEYLCGLNGYHVLNVTDSKTNTNGWITKTSPRLVIVDNSNNLIGMALGDETREFWNLVSKLVPNFVKNTFDKYDKLNL